MEPIACYVEFFDPVQAVGGRVTFEAELSDYTVQLFESGGRRPNLANVIYGPFIPVEISEYYPIGGHPVLAVSGPPQLVAHSDAIMGFVHGRRAMEGWNWERGAVVDDGVLILERTEDILDPGIPGDADRRWLDREVNSRIAKAVALPFRINELSSDVEGNAKAIDDSRTAVLAAMDTVNGVIIPEIRVVGLEITEVNISVTEERKILAGASERLGEVDEALKANGNELKELSRRIGNEEGRADQTECPFADFGCHLARFGVFLLHVVGVVFMGALAYGVFRALMTVRMKRNRLSFSRTKRAVEMAGIAVT